jgi:isopentenyl diphosphate isomerase/L-lactate dehydrogenase-like FMN-dependent dehydrogenase
VKAVAGKAEVVVDGGFMRGADVLKAIALGAKAVGVGRLHGCGLAADGQAGVARVLELLEAEIRLNMGLLGVTKLDQITPLHLHPAPLVRSGHPFHSAFPLLDLPEVRY